MRIANHERLIYSASHAEPSWRIIDSGIIEIYFSVLSIGGLGACKWRAEARRLITIPERRWVPMARYNLAEDNCGDPGPSYPWLPPDLKFKSPWRQEHVSARSSVTVTVNTRDLYTFRYRLFSSWSYLRSLINSLPVGSMSLTYHQELIYCFP